MGAIVPTQSTNHYDRSSNHYDTCVSDYVSGGSRTVPIGLPSTYNRGFEGCIHSVNIDEEPLNLVQDLSSHGTVQFCPL